ncbi:MAG: prepilin-type N-terminal cleavage/methylation domain-containing protein [Geobacteraceae bacterium]
MRPHVQKQISKSNNYGFTLIEVLVAVVILMVGLLGVMKSLNLAIRTNLQTEMRTQGSMIGEAQMAKIKTLPFANITGATEKSFTVPVNMRSTILNFTVTKKIDFIPSGDTSATTKRVNVGVSWTYRGNHQDYVVSSVVTDPSAH